MPVNKKFLAARAAERTHRDHAHLRSLCWVPLKRRGVVFARAPIVPLTRRHRVELTLAGNAFFTTNPVLLGDVFLFLWRLHPLYRAPRFGRESAVAGLAHKRCHLLRQWYALGSLGLACLHSRLTRFVRRCDLAAVTAAIEEFIDRAYQDAPGEDAGEARARRHSCVAPERHPTDNLTEWLMSNYRLSHDEALDFPIALGHQFYRERDLQHPDGELRVFAPSDLLLAEDRPEQAQRVEGSIAMP